MGKKSPAPPPAPDYAAIARQQGAANVEAARTSAYMSNPNVYTPYGTQTVTWSRTPNFDETGYQKALEAWQSGGMYGEDGSRSTAMPTREQFTSYIEQPTVRQEVPYWAQTAINNELQAQARLAMAANEASARLGDLPIAQQFTGAGIPGITYEGAGVRPIEAHLNLMGYGTPVSQVTPLATPEAARVVGQASGGPAPEQLQALNLSGVAPVQAAPTGGQFGMAAGGPAGGLFGMASGGPGGLQLGGLDTSGIGGVARGPEQGQFGAAQRFVQRPELQRQIDLEGIAQGPVNAGTTAQQAIMSRLSPQLQGERQQLYTQLINQGLRPGGEAFNAAMQGQMQKENDLLLQAAAQGISLDQAARQQQFAEQQSRAMFANQAALQGFGAGMEQAGLFNVGAQQDLQAALATQAAQNQAQQQAFQQRLQAGEFGQEAQLASFGTQQSAADAYNRAIAQNFAQAQAAQQMGNQAIGQNFEQALAAQQAANAAQAQQFGQAVGAGEFDRQRLLAQFGMGQGASEAYNQALAQNQAAQIAVQQANLGRQQQNFGQQMSQAELANAALQQQRQAAIDQNAFYNQALQQMYNQEMGQSQFYNTAVQQALAQQAAIRSLPINEISALLSGGQVNVPQFQGYSGVTVAPAPIFQAGQAQGDFAQRNYQNQVGAYNAQMGLLGQLGGAIGSIGGGGQTLAGFFGTSDRRLKSNIVRVGTHPLGIGVYEYDIAGERQRGVMADELEMVLPEAVVTRHDGYKMVNYGML